MLLQRRFLLMALLLALAPTVAFPAAAAAAQKATRPAKSRLTTSVQALLKRAAKETDAAALKTLAEAQKQAEQRKDRAGLLAVADLAQARGMALWCSTRNFADLPNLGPAKPFFERAVRIRERLLPDSVPLAESLTCMAWTLPPEKAKPLVQRALAMATKAGGSDSIEVAYALQHLASLAHINGNVPEVAPLLRRSIAIQERRAPNSLRLAHSYVELGFALRDQGNGRDRRATKAAYQHSFTVRARHKGESGQDVFRHAWAFYEMGALCEADQDLAAARGYFLRCIAVATTSNDLLLLPIYEAGVEGLARAVAQMKDPAMERDFHARLVSLEKMDRAKRIVHPTRLFGLAALAEARKDRSAAFRYWKQAFEAQEKRGDPSSVSPTLLWRMAEIGGADGSLAAQRRWYERGASLAHRVGPFPAGGGPGDWSKGKLAYIAYFQGDFAEASKQFQATGNVYGLGHIARIKGDLAAAKVYYQRAVTSRRINRNVWLSNPLGALGHVLLTLGDVAGARKAFQEALAVREEYAPRSAWIARSQEDFAEVARKEGDLAAAKAFYEKSLAIQQSIVEQPSGDTLYGLGVILDESGDTSGAVTRFREALGRRDESDKGYGTLLILRALARLLLEGGYTEEARQYLKRADEIEERIKSLPRSTLIPAGENGVRATLPEVRFLGPDENAEVKGGTVEITVALLAPIPLARYRLWINGRSFGGEKGFELPLPDEKGRLLEKGRVLEKGRLLEKGEDRAALAKELPAEIAELVKQSQYAHFQQLRLTLPIEDTDGEFLRIAVQAETTGGSIGDRQILRLRRPQAASNRGSLRVLAIGVSDYQNLPKLQYAHRDTLDLGDAFRAQAGNGKLYKGADITVVTDAEATLPRVRQAVDQFATNVRPGDTLILALSGHGLKKGAVSYFAPVQTDPENVEGTGLPWREVLAKLETARKTARSVWVLADACRAAPGLRRELVATAADLKRGVDDGGNLVICTASSGDTPSYESEDLKHGIFTQAWLEALRGDAPQLVYEEVARGKVLTLSGLQFAVDTSVRRHARKEGVRQAVEFPRLEGSFSPSQPLFVPVAR